MSIEYFKINSIMFKRESPNGFIYYYNDDFHSWNILGSLDDYLYVSKFIDDREPITEEEVNKYIMLTELEA